MRFSTLLAATTIAVSSAVASPQLLGRDVLGFDLSVGNYYGAPNAPWVPGASPGWYNGQYPWLYPELPCLVGGLLCALLNLLPLNFLHCPAPGPLPSPDGYTQTFSGLDGATQAGDYLTYGLVDTVAQCKAMCNTVSGCHFVNTYHDVNGKGGSTQLTCSLFSSCHTSSDAINKGGQTQPNGSVNYIANSDGYCKA